MWTHFIIPRMLQREYGRLSKFVIYSGQFEDSPLSFTPLAPFVLYYIPPFNRREIYQKESKQIGHTFRPYAPLDQTRNWWSAQGVILQLTLVPVFIYASFITLVLPLKSSPTNHVG